MHSILPTPVLSLTPDSLASLGDLDGDSLSELWGVFTKCKDSLQNGRRLENLSWRLWFDSGRRESASLFAHDKASRDASFTAADGIAQAEAEGWSDPEWTEATDSESEGEQQPASLRAGRASRRNSGGVAAGDALPVPTTPHASRSGSACTHEPRPSLTREWRSSSTISGGSIQRIITGLTSLPPLAVPIKAHSVVDVAAPLLASPMPGLTSRHSSAPDELERTPMMTSGPLPALHPSPRKTVDAPTQTTPSTSHRPSPKMSPQLSWRNPLSPPAATATVGASTSRTSSTNLAHTPLTTSSQVNLSRRLSSPRPPPSTPASFIHDASHPSNLPPAIRAQSSAHLNRIPSEVGPASNASFEGRSFVKGFDTSVFDSRPRPGSIAPPPTPAVALAKLGASPPKRPTSALKVSPKSNGTASTSKATPMAAGRPKTGGTAKKIFFISSPNSDSEDDHSSTHSHSRSRSVSVDQHTRRPSISSSLTRGLAPAPTEPVVKPASKAAPKEEEEDDWDDEDDEEDESGSSSGWGSEYSTEDESRPSRNKASTSAAAPSTSDPTPDRPLFSKMPSQPALHNSELKPRPPGLLSQLFHPDLFLDDSDRRHSTVDVSRQSATGELSRPRLLQTSKSAGVLTDKLRTSRSKSYLKGAPADVELESSSEEEDDGSMHSDDSEDDSDDEDYATDDDEEPSPPSAAANGIATALARQQRLHLEASALIAPPQTPRTTRRAMLATELSESLRRNLLWERQTRNRVMGGPVNRFAQAHAQGVAPNGQPRQLPAQTAPPIAEGGAFAAAAAAPTSTLAPPPPTTKSPLDTGLRAPHPSPATREPSPSSRERTEMVRRHTTGTGLYLAAQRDRFPGEGRKERRRRRERRRGSAAAVNRRGGSESESESESETDSESEEEEEEEVVRVERRERRKSSSAARNHPFGDVWGQRVW